MSESKLELQCVFAKQIENMMHSILGQIELPHQCCHEFRFPESEYHYLVKNPQIIYVSVDYCAKRDDAWKIASNLHDAQKVMLSYLPSKLEKLGYKVHSEPPSQEAIYDAAADDGEEVNREYERTYSALALKATLDDKTYKKWLKSIKDQLKEHKKSKTLAKKPNEHIYKTNARSFDFTGKNWDRFNSVTFRVHSLNSLKIKRDQLMDLTISKNGDLKLTDRHGNELIDELKIVIAHIEKKVGLETLVKTIFTNNRVFAVRCLTYFLLLQPWYDNLVDVKFSNSRLKSR